MAAVYIQKIYCHIEFSYEIYLNLIQLNNVCSLSLSILQNVQLGNKTSSIKTSFIANDAEASPAKLTTISFVIQCSQRNFDIMHLYFLSDLVIQKNQSVWPTPCFSRPMRRTLRCQHGQSLQSVPTRCLVQPGRQTHKHKVGQAHAHARVHTCTHTRTHVFI